jgi:hypothetical protein
VNPSLARGALVILNAIDHPSQEVTKRVKVILVEFFILLPIRAGIELREYNG